MNNIYGGVTGEPDTIGDPDSAGCDIIGGTTKSNNDMLCQSKGVANGDPCFA